MLPPSLLGISRGVPPSRRGGSRQRRRRRLRWCLRLVVAMPHIVPPPPLAISTLRRLLSADASPPLCLLYASPPVCLLFASWLSHCPCCCATAALQLCLYLFIAIWLLQLATPHLLECPHPPSAGTTKLQRRVGTRKRQKKTELAIVR